jgi:hypothetical protein
MKYRSLVLAAALAALAFDASAQKKKPSFNESLAAKKPLWIAMMDDTTANFFVVEKAFDTYFKNHEMPEGEHDVIGEYAEREKKHISRRKQRKMEREDALRMDVRRYYRWHEQTLPYVQADGRILTPSQRLKIWREQQPEQK